MLKIKCPLFVSVLPNVCDFRKAKGKRFALSILLYSLLLTEFKNCRKQRHKIDWLNGNWDWIRESFEPFFKDKIPKKAFFQSTLSRLLQSLDLCGLKEQYFAEIRKLNETKCQIEDLHNKEKTNKPILKHYSFDGKSRKGIVT